MADSDRAKFTREEIKDLCRRKDEPVITAVEVAEEFGVTQQAAHKRLMNMYKDDELDRRKVGSRAVVWWPLGN